MNSTRVSFCCFRSSLWALFFFLCTVFLAACENSEIAKSACDGLSKKKMGITREEYLPCACEIMAVLDNFRQQLKKVLKGNREVLPEAKQSYQELRALIKKTGIDRDHASSHPGREIERWPDLQVRALNSCITAAKAQYGSCLAKPNQGNFNEGVRHHEEAIKIYQRIR